MRFSAMTACSHEFARRISRYLRGCLDFSALLSVQSRISETPGGHSITAAAVFFASAMHAGQRRRIDGAPFIEHPLEVAALLYNAGEPDHVVAAGALHDVLEKTDATPSELTRRFGPAVTELVVAVSENPGIRGFHARKAALRRGAAAAGDAALVVFAADKVSKVRELRLGAGPPPVDRLIHYRSCLRLLERRLPGNTLVRQLRSELEALRAGAKLPTGLAAVGPR
jgi:(p)ppGpp synthase/HD superfamily hydrolase